MLTVEARLEKLERSNRWLRGLIGTFGLALAAMAIVAADTPAPQDAFFKTVFARAFVVSTNRNGKWSYDARFGHLGVLGDGGTYLELDNSKGKMYAQLLPDQDVKSPRFTLYNGRTEGLVSLDASDSGSGQISIFDPGTGVAAKAESNPVVVQMRANAARQGLVAVYNQSEQPLASMSGDETGGRLAVYSKAGKALASVRAMAGYGMFASANEEGQELAWLGGSEKGDGALGTNTGAGQPLFEVHAADAGGAELTAFNAKGQRAVGLGAAVNARGGAVSAYDQNGKLASNFGISDDEASGSISLFSTKDQKQVVWMGGTDKGQGNLTTYGPNGTRLVELTASDQGHGTISTFDAKANEAARMTADGGSGRLSIYSDKQQEVVTLSDTTDGHGGVFTYSAKGQEMCRLSASKQGGEGLISTLNDQGHSVIQLGINEKRHGVVRTFDDKGQVRVGVGADLLGFGGFTAFDAQGNEKVNVVATAAGGAITLLNALGKEIIRLDVEALKGGRLVLSDIDGKPLKE